MFSGDSSSNSAMLFTAVTVDASHQCMTDRGIKKENTTTVTNYFLGAFKDDLSFQNRYLRYINKE